MMPVAAPQILYTLGYRQDEHHRNDGHRSESLEGEWHKIVFCIHGHKSCGLSIRQGTAQFVSFQW